MDRRPTPIAADAIDPEPDIGRIEVPQRNSLLPTKVCYFFCRMAGSAGSEIAIRPAGRLG
jgi:hypothetical protein